jgi:branched-chain amino acid transport system permease protein
VALDQFILFTVDLLALFSVYLIINLGLNLQEGVTGIPNFGIVLAVAGGAYIAASLSTRLAIYLLNVQTNLDPIYNNVAVLQLVNPVLRSSPWLSIGLLILFLIIGGASGTLMGLISSAPAVRLREDYLAITLLAFGEILNVIGTGFDPLVGGPPGVNLPDIFGWAGQYRFYWATLIMLVVAAIVFAYIERLIKTPFGRVLKAIRDNENTARSLGKDITRYRMSSILIGSMLCGIAGTLWALYSGAVTPSYDRFDWTFLPWLMILLGGMGSNAGAVVGTFVFATLDKLITYFKYEFASFLPFDVVWLNYLLLGLLTIFILIYRPEGIVREKWTPVPPTQPPAGETKAG